MAKNKGIRLEAGLDMLSSSRSSSGIDPAMMGNVRRFIRRNIPYDSAKKIFKDNVLCIAFNDSSAIPVEIFCSELGALESIVKYLRENACLSFPEISAMLGRSVKTVWASYSRASKKSRKPFIVSNPNESIPASILLDRQLGVQESIAVYLKDNRGLSYHKIAQILKRDDRTVWSSCSRARKKLEAGHHDQKMRRIGKLSRIGRRGKRGRLV